MIKTTNRTPSSSAPQSSSRSNDLKREFEALSQGKKPPSTLPIEVFDLSDSEAGSGGEESSRRGIGSEADRVSLDKAEQIDDDENNEDGNDAVTAWDALALPTVQTIGSVKGDGSSSAGLQAASTRSSRRKNTARCSRGRGGRKLYTSSEATMRKISSFKPMKPRPQTSAVAAPDTLNGAASEEIVAPSASASPPPPSHTKVAAQEADTSEGNTTGIIPPADRHGELNSPSPDEDTGSEEFHELPEFRRSMSRHTEEAEPPATNKRKRKTTAFEGSYDSDLPLARTIIRNHQPMPNHSDAAAAGSYVSKDEFDRTISALREEMRQEVDKMREAMRIETKRLIRAEVKDEILLTQEHKN